MSRITPPLKWHGGKYYLAPQIVELMRAAPHTHYVEPYAGGLQVLLAKGPEGVSEVVNDMNGELMNFWRVLADPLLFADFRRRIEATPFSESLWREVVAHRERYGPFTGQSDVGWLGRHDMRVMDACAFFVWCRQSLAGRMDSFTGVTRTRTRRGMNNEVSAWLGCIEGLPAIHERLMRVLILGPSPALDVIRAHDGPDTLVYCDPPYLHETRQTTGEYGPHEMSSEDHADLCHTLAHIKGKFVLSGYANPLYDMVAEGRGWRRRDFDLPNNAAGGEQKRRMTESVWSNF